jgi:hypothetical protein
MFSPVSILKASITPISPVPTASVSAPAAPAAPATTTIKGGKSRRRHNKTHYRRTQKKHRK